LISTIPRSTTSRARSRNISSKQEIRARDDRNDRCLARSRLLHLHRNNYYIADRLSSSLAWDATRRLTITVQYAIGRDLYDVPVNVRTAS